MSEAKHSPDNKLFNYLCEIGAIPIDTEVHEIRLIVYEELGLSGIDNPREWVKLMKGHKEITGFQTPSELAAYEKGRNDEEKVMVKFIGDWQPNETNSVIGQLLADKNNKLQAELKSLQEFNEVIIRERDWQLEVVVPDLENQIEAVRAELKQAKAEAWDEGFKSGKNYVESSMSCDEGVRLPENPYK